MGCVIVSLMIAFYLVPSSDLSLMGFEVHCPGSACFRHLRRYITCGAGPIAFAVYPSCLSCCAYQERSLNACFYSPLTFDHHGPTVCRRTL
jgi:hypothetical protein